MKKYRYFGGFGGSADQQQRGFTLTELLVTMAILVILIAIAAPELRTLIAQRAVSSQAETFAEAIRLTRSEALKRGQRVTMCTSANPIANPPACSANAAADWRQGWVIFVDDGTTIGSFNTGDAIIKVQQAFSLSGGIQASSDSLTRGTISFTPNGMGLGNANSFQVSPNMTGANATVDSNNRCVVLSRAGRIQIQKQACPRS